MRSNFFKLGLAAIFSLGSLLGTTSASSASAYDDELLIGDFQILSGAAAAGGLGNHRGLILAINHYNEGVHPLNKTKGLTVGGKTYKLTTVVYDHKYTTEGGITAANKLVFDDGAKFVVGTYGSAPSISAAEVVFEPNKILFATTGWSSKCIGADKPYTFRLHLTALQYNGAFYAYAKKELPHLKTIALLVANDESGFQSAKDIKAVAENMGFTIVAEEYYDRGTVDYYPFLTRVLKANPDVLETGGASPGEEALMFKQLYELGGNIAVSGSGQTPEVILDIAGDEASEGVYLAQTVNYESGPPMISDQQRKFAADYRATFNEPDVPMQAEKVYDMAVGLFEAMKKADSLDTTVVRDELEKFNWMLTSGDMSRWGGEKTYGIKHQLITPVYINQIQNGKVITIGKVLPDVE
jgi:branched-chain amino acid transport system substrate-binding protein